MNDLDIQVGDRVTYKDLDRNKIYTQMINYIGMRKDLMKTKYYEIIKIERPKYEVVEEKKDLLTDEERKFLEYYIKYLKLQEEGKIIMIEKESSEIWFLVGDRIRYTYSHNAQAFKGLEIDKLYTLKDLGLEE